MTVKVVEVDLGIEVYRFRETDTREGVPLNTQECQQHDHKKEMGVTSSWELHHATMPLPQMIIW